MRSTRSTPANRATVRWMRFAQRRAVQQRRRHQLARARHRLPRRDGLGRRPGGDDDRLEQAERVPRAVRPSSPESVRQRRLRHRPGGHDHRHRRLRRPVERHRPGQRGLRLQAEHHAGDRQLHLHSRGKHSYKFGFDYQRIYDERTAAPQFLYTFPTHRRRISTAKSGANPLGYTTMTQITGDLELRHGHEHLQRVRPGRLADRADA